jgi:uncharacterized protein (DUF1800 family)
MINPNATLTDSHARHLLRRTGFGFTANEFAAVQGMTRGAAATRLLAFKPKNFKPGGRYFEQSHDKWIKYILKSKYPLMEKLVLFWHDHFSVGISKVFDTKLMAQYVGVLHFYCKGDFKAFVKAIGKNAAMMEFLDTVRNFKEIPNENYGRELLELFSLGVYDYAPTPQPNYTQDDIVQIARAFTGWTYEGNGKTTFYDYRHDYTEEFDGDPEEDRGPKVIFAGRPGFPGGGASFTAGGEGPNEIDEVVDIIFEHLDSQGNNTVARRTAYRLCEYFAHTQPSLAFVDEIVDDSNFATTWDIGALCQSMFCSDDFYLTAGGPPYVGGSKKSVKWPIDYVVGTLRMLGVKPRGGDLRIYGGNYRRVLDHLSNMGQILLDPPSVFGWDWETAWVSSATMLARYSFARDIAASRDGSASFRPDKLMSLSLTNPGQIVDAVTGSLGITDQVSAAERTVLINYLTDDGANPTLDLTDYDTRNTKLHGLFALVMQSPAYQLH